MVSVLMSVFNGGDYLNESISSILNQTYSDFELIIINDGSIDNSEEIILAYKDNRIRYFKNDQNRGLIFSLNKGLSESNGDYIVRMDADDVCHPDRFKILFYLMEKNQDISIMGSSVIDFSSYFPSYNLSSIELIDFKIINSIAFFNCPLLHPTVIIRFDFLKENNLLYDSNYIHAEDNALWLDSIKKGKVLSIDYPLLKYRRHPDQVSNIHNKTQHINSTKKRVEFLESIADIKLSENEINIYRSICYKYDDLTMSEFNNINRFIIKFENSILNQEYIKIDKRYFSKLLYNRVSLLYLRNSHLGFPLLINYFSNFMFNFKIFTSLKLIRRIVYGI
ncbi:glycosyltransferase involved in cell wall biosynthesis [Algoriphagus iocasae]|uniref:Glycosyltransferase involved in cell wall biosynthesis n=1 Tax=Algoriphagus iocasae TaxID=1836499 RepID=A0A841N0T7_9BACT|nr:glycosyltransferase family 2 protein [Algoriphagus iocasae]MBB6327821.1 glycosyltransferase involved in cell wall biosynthesis [Algoriphagus iocasae]